MLGTKISLAAAVSATLTAAAPAPGFDKAIRAVVTSTPQPQPSQGYDTSRYSRVSSIYSSMMPTTPTASRATGMDSQVAASTVPSMSAYDLVSSQVTGPTSHGPYEGTPTITGAPQSGPAATSLPNLGPAPTATYYNANGELTEEEPLPYTPAGKYPLLTKVSSLSPTFASSLSICFPMNESK